MCLAQPPQTDVLKKITRTIQAHGRCNHWNEALVALDQLQTIHLQIDAVCCGSALQTCSRQGWQQAIRLFWQTRLNFLQPSLISTNVIVRTTSNHEPWAKVLHFLSWTTIADFRADAHTFGAMLGSFPWFLSLQVLQKTETTPILLNTAISAMSTQETKSWPWSFHFLSDFRCKRLTADTVLLNTLLTTLERSCRWKSAIQLLALCIKKCGIATPNTVSFNACLSACESAEELEHALALLQAMEMEHQIQPDVVSFSAVLSACAKTAQWETALEQLVNMRCREIFPDTIAYNSVTTACSEAIQWQKCLQILKLTSLTSADQVMFNAILKGMEKSMLWQHALILLRTMELGHSLKGNLITYNTLMSTCQKCSQWERSLHFFLQLGLVKLIPDLVSYNTCLAACRKGAAWQQALQLWKPLQHRMDVVGHLELLAACMDSGQMDLAPVILEGMMKEVSSLFVEDVEALRPLGLAVTASDYLDSMQIDTSASDVLERCLQRYMMNPSLCQLENLDPAAISGFGRSTRLRDRILERQHSLGVHFTRQALEGLCESYEGWASWTVRAKRFCLSNLALHGPETFQSQDRSASTILAWASYNFDADLSRGRVNGFQQDRSERDQWLPPIQVEHERSGHAERQALLNLIQTDTLTSGASFPSMARGAVRLFVTHTLCISCLAACFQYKRLYPAVRFAVAFTVL